MGLPKIYDMMSGKLGLGPSTLLSRDEIIKLIPNEKKWFKRRCDL